MDASSHAPPELVEIRRYSNRRFYDTSRSKHVTLEEIRQMILGGQNLRITDATSGEDITSRTLTQIILEYDDQKITAIPSAMLHRLIRSSESLLHEFMRQYFENATRLFYDSRRSMEEGWQRMGGLAPLPEEAARWWSGEPLAEPAQPGAAAEGEVPARKAEAADDLNAVVEELRSQLEVVRAELRELQAGEAKAARPAAKRKRKTPKQK